MPCRPIISILFLGILAVGVSSGQQGTAEVPIPRNVYGGILACGGDGQAYFHSLGSEYFVLRASLDGSNVIFRIPDKEYVDAVAPYADGVNILSPRLQPEKKRIIYHFDNLGNLLARHFVSTDLDDTMMATTSSGTTILVGRSKASENDDWEYGGIVIDTDDRVVSRFKLPSPPVGGGWDFGISVRLLMTADDKAAYVLLYSDEPAATEIASISESGKISIRNVPAPIVNDQHKHIMWFVGPGVVAEQYYQVQGGHLVGGPVYRFDEYDVRSGQQIGSKTAHMGSATPFTAACYYRNSVTGLGTAGQVAPDKPYLRLRIAKLQ